jgi:membrane-bound serine protease (ClpP class)
MISAKTPVAVFIAPGGARAASAGFLLTIAADVAAMAPGTAVGAAHPVSGDGQPVDQTVAKKAAADVAAYARSIATQRKRNVALAEQAVLESKAFTDVEARQADPPLVDLTARDLDDLLAQLDERTVTRFDGSQVTLHTANARIEHVQMTWRQRVLSAVAHPQVAYLLFTLGTLGLTIELWNPGSVLPGVVGGLCLLLAFFAFQILPVNYAGLALILFGLLLLVLEVKVASFGLLAIGGLLSLVFGSLMLFDAPVPELRLALGFVLPIVGGFAFIVLLLVKLAVDSQRRRASTGQAGMIAARGSALTAIPAGGTGRVATHGEIWNATSDEAIAVDEPVEILVVDGLTLRVKRATPAKGGDLP